MASLEQLRALLDGFLADPDAIGELRETYTGIADPLDVLSWRIDPAGTAPSGAPSTLPLQRALELKVHSRPSGPDGEQAQGRAAAELAALLRERAEDDAALDAAIAKMTARRLPAAPADPAAVSRGWLRWVPWAALGVAAAIAVGVVLGTLPAAPAVVPTASPTAAPVAKPALIGYDALWAELMNSYPDAKRPQVQVVRLVSQDDFIPSVVQCLTEAGFDARLVGTTVQVTPGAQARRGELNLAIYVCKLEYPVDPLAIFDRPQTATEAAYENGQAMRMGFIDGNTGEIVDQKRGVLGTGRFLLLTDEVEVFAYREVGPSPDDLNYCVQKSHHGEKTSSFACVTRDQFREAGLKPSGLIWSPNGDLKITG